MNKHLGLLLLLTTGLFLTTGCVVSGGSPIRYYLIDPTPQSALRQSSQPLAVEIMDLHIPQYLERFQIASRRGRNQLSFSDGHQWGENLRKNLTRTMARNLSRLLDTVDVGTPTDRSSSKPDYRIQVYIEQFERDESGQVKLSARWQVMSGANDKVPSTEGVELSSERTNSAGDYEGMVESMQLLFSELSRRIAQSIMSLEIVGKGR